MQLHLPMGNQAKLTPVTIKNVFYAPCLVFTLLSVSSMDQVGFALHVKDRSCSISTLQATTYPHLTRCNILVVVLYLRASCEVVFPWDTVLSQGHQHKWDIFIDHGTILPLAIKTWERLQVLM